MEEGDCFVGKQTLIQFLSGSLETSFVYHYDIFVVAFFQSYGYVCTVFNLVLHKDS